MNTLSSFSGAVYVGLSLISVSNPEAISIYFIRGFVQCLLCLCTNCLFEIKVK